MSSAFFGVEPHRRDALLRRTATSGPGLSVLAVVAVLAAGCDQLPGGPAAAVWTLAPDQQIDAGTTELTVLVSRLGCNSGVTGAVQEPDVRVDDETVVLTFVVEPGEPTAAGCPGNDEVTYDVVLPEPLGRRSLVDGQCADAAEANRSSFCLPDGVRHRP